MIPIPLSWYAIGALTLALAGTGWALKSQVKANGAARAQIQGLQEGIKRAQEQRKLDQATLARLAKKNAATARETARLRASLGAALAANRPWADAPVPKDIQDALRKP